MYYERCRTTYLFFPCPVNSFRQHVHGRVCVFLTHVQCHKSGNLKYFSAYSIWLLSTETQVNSIHPTYLTICQEERTTDNALTLTTFDFLFYVIRFLIFLAFYKSNAPVYTLRYRILLELILNTNQYIKMTTQLGFFFLCDVLICMDLSLGMLSTSFLCFVCLFFSVQLLSALRGHSVFSSPTTTANDLRLWRISIPDLIHYITFLT